MPTHKWNVLMVCLLSHICFRYAFICSFVFSLHTAPFGLALLLYNEMGGSDDHVFVYTLSMTKCGTTMNEGILRYVCNKRVHHFHCFSTRCWTDNFFKEKITWKFVSIHWHLVRVAAILFFSPHAETSARRCVTVIKKSKLSSSRAQWNHEYSHLNIHATPVIKPIWLEI